LSEYKVWGWVKTSANFIKHIKILKGAKLSVWNVIALSVDENGVCNLTIKQLCELTGYSHTEVIDSVKELDVMGYLSVNREGKKNLYTPEFAARGTNNPSQETLVKKLDSTPVYQYESSSPEVNSVPSYKELKELIKPDILDGEMHFKLKPESVRKAVKKYFRLNVNWDTKLAREWVEWAVKEEITAEQISRAADSWKSNRLFNWQPPTLKGIFEKWDMLMENAEDKSESYRPRITA
jgi:hypothetical protein